MIISKRYLIVLLSLVSSLLFAQNNEQNPVSQMPFQKRMEGFSQRNSLRDSSLVSNVEFRSVGPTIMSGRVVDVDVSPFDPTHFYVAYASGGLWVTNNNGQSFEPLFDSEAVMTIGDIAVDWNHNETIWIGTGENNSSRSSYSGLGIFKSSDKGKTWQHSGLGESHHVGRIVLHPTDRNILWAAVIGHLYSPNVERGVYKTVDGGVTWKKALFIDDNTGAIDLVADPSDPKVLYAAMWHRQRRAWNFTESGSSSGIYRSTDGGDSWKLISTRQSGFPSGEGVGRIGLDVFRKDPNVLYSVVDNQTRRAKKKDEKTGISKDTIRNMSKEKFLLLSDSLLKIFLKENDFEEEYTAQRIKEMIKADSIKPVSLVEYLEDANSQLFDTDVTGAEVYRSDDAGVTWKKTHIDFLDDVFNTYGYYFGQIRISPDDDKKIFTVGVPIIKSEDGGKTFKSIDADNMHGDYHALWINPQKDGHMIVGNDGGLNITYDDGKTYFKANTPAVGQFYSVQVDMEKPYNVYGGLQDNGVWSGPSTYKESMNWYGSGRYPYKFLLGGDGMQVMVDTRDNNTVYTGFQFGYYYRVNKSTGESKSIKPGHKLGHRPLRFNWQTPIWLSQHNQDILYMGSNKFHRSMNKGNDFKTLSGDLTQGGKKGDVAYGTFTSIHESPLKFGLIYVGTDDGLVHVSQDAGYSFKRISDKLPPHLWVSRVIASAFDTATVYVSLNGYRWDDFTSYLYVSKNYGQSWERIGINLPAEPVNVVREDVKNKNVLFVGTDHSVYVSLDRGKKFMAMNGGLPSAPVHDLVIQQRENDLVVGTHGRSIYIANINELQKMNDTLLKKDIYVFELEPSFYNKNWGKIFYKWGEPNEPKKVLSYYVKEKGISKISVFADNDILLRQLSDTSERGLNYYNYDMTVDSVFVINYQKFLTDDKKLKAEDSKIEKADNGRYYLKPGKYIIEVEAGNGIKSKQEFTVKEKKREE